MAKYTLSLAAATAICDLYTKLGAGALTYTGNDSTPAPTNEFAATDLARALSTIVVFPQSVSDNTIKSLRQLEDGDEVIIALDPCIPCQKRLISCMNTLNAIFEHDHIVPNTHATFVYYAYNVNPLSSNNTLNNANGVVLCTIIKPGYDKCLCG